MGTLVGHVLHGSGFLLIGLWHLFNHIKLQCQHPKTYRPPFWFPFPGGVRHLELYLIMAGGLASICSELFIVPSRHHPLDPTDWTIPADHLHNFEHSTISLSIVIYAAFALRFDRRAARTTSTARGGQTVSMLIAAAAFAVELLMFYLHSTDHAGLEWQYHRLLQPVVASTLITTLLGVAYPRSFAVGFTRSVGVVFQGVWFTVLGVMLYTPGFIPKGCRLMPEGGGAVVVPCDDTASLQRGKALVNLQFAWAFTAVIVFSGWLYQRMADKYPELPEYECLGLQEEGQKDDFPRTLEEKHEREREREVQGPVNSSTWISLKGPDSHTWAGKR